MKTLYINRHAKSSWKDLNISDFDRSLNKRGKINAGFMAERFAEDAQIDIIISSPAIRALSTAEAFAEALGIDRIQAESSIYGAGIREMVHIINSIPNQFESALIFGHNPTFTNLAHHLDHNFNDHLVTCARVKFEFEVDDWGMIGSDSGIAVSHHYPRMYPEMENL
jgi:phosphohistidine phosphatase